MTVSPEHASPLANWSERFAQASTAAGDFSIREALFLAQIDLRGNAADPAFALTAQSVLGFDLPIAPNTWSGQARRSALWLGPDEWLIADADGRSTELDAALRTALGGVHYAVTDVSASRTAIEVSGADARVVLAKGCSLDLHASAFRVPQVAQSLLAKAQIILQLMDNRPLFRLLVRNSFAAYLADWLLDAAAECAAARNAGVADIASRLA